jgi:hypothetical protein
MTPFFPVGRKFGPGRGKWALTRRSGFCPSTALMDKRRPGGYGFLVMPMTMRTIYSILAVLGLLSAGARAEVQIIDIPHQTWVIRVDCPPFTQKREDPHLDDFTFKGISGNFTLSLIVEKPSGGLAHKDCFDFYWRLVEQDPTIKRNSIKVSHTGDWSRVEYLIEVPVKGKIIRQKHVNYYFAYQRKWMDLHIKYVGYEPKDEKIFKAFDAGLNYTGRR